MSLSGHLWTIAALASRPPRFPEPPLPWGVDVADARHGTVKLAGSWRPVRGARTAVLVVHGLGGSPEAAPVRRAERAAVAAGASCLRLALRGADGRGEDIYHAGLTGDLRAALEAPGPGDHDAVVVLGFSLGGHLALRLATEGLPGRVRAVAAVCPPLDLCAAADAFDGAVHLAYRLHVLHGLKRTHAQVALRGRAAAPQHVVEGVRTIRDWDRLTVVPRFGFDSPDDYYRRASAGPRLDRLSTPCLLVLSRADPMVPAATVAPSLSRRSPALDVRWIDRGGHVGFPCDLDLGQRAGRGLEPQVVAWLLGR